MRRLRDVVAVASFVLVTMASFISFVAQANAQDAPENLDEMFARKARKGKAVWGASYLEDARTFVWQPETLCYRDVTTGHEVWRMSNTPGPSTLYHNDIGVSPWNADGSKMAIAIFDRVTQAYDQKSQRDWRYLWATVDTTGRFMRPAVEGARRLSGNYFHWSPQIPEVYYEVGEPHLGTGAKTDVLYKQVVDRSGVITREALVTLPSGGAINKMISADGRKVILEGNGTYLPVTIWPDEKAKPDLAKPYSMDRGFERYGNMQGGEVRNYHDQYIAGDGSWYFAMPSGSAVWWRIKTLGSAPDGGAKYTGNDGNNDFGEVWPENHGHTIPGSKQSPWVTPTSDFDPRTGCYWSHFIPDRWGRCALFSNAHDRLPKGYGPGVWDIQKHTWGVPSFGGGGQHHDWHGFTDWTVSSGGSMTNRGCTMIRAQRYNEPQSQITVNSAYTRSDGGSGYGSLIRPGQSPDGTKVSWHSEFLNGKDAVDIFWSVVYYPAPPTGLDATYADGVRIAWLPPKYTERGWPYADPNPRKNPNGWPLLDAKGLEIGEPLYAREIKTFHVWRASRQNGPWEEIAAVLARYSATYKEKGREEWLMLHPVTDDGLKVDEGNKIAFTDRPGDGTWYYAVTSEEHSTLESQELSEILKVELKNERLMAAVVEKAGQKDFWKRPPASPANVVSERTDTPGHFILSWEEPRDAKVRHYNVYYSATGLPKTDQRCRIASLAVGTTRYLDWLAKPDAPAFYVVTSVDRQGNESAPVAAAARQVERGAR